MSANTVPIFPLTPFCKSASLAAATACTTRGPVLAANLATANLTLLADASTNGLRIDKIVVQASSTAIGSATVAGLVGLWVFDTANAFLIDEFVITAVTPSATAAAFNTYKTFTNLVLPPTYKLYVSSTITTLANTTALTVTAFGGAY